MSQYNKIQWVIQRNLTSENIIETIKKACDDIGVACYEVDVIPFSEKLPDFPKGKRTIFYGSTTTIRPNDDSKSFSGEVKRFDEIHHWFEQIKASPDVNLTPETKIIIGEPYHIKHEWRLWIVNGKVITASKYREDFKLKKERGCPQDVIDFAEMRCQEYHLHDVFVMDIGYCGDALYIIECGCMNSAGFYNADIGNIVRSVTKYFSEKSPSV
jgi:ATP-grasp domain, R2K clade family 3